MRTYTWDEYYEKFYDWAESTQVRNLSGLISLGAADEVGEIIIELQHNEAASNRLLRKAVQEKLAFCSENILNFAGTNDEQLLTEAVRNSVNNLKAEDMEYLYGEIEDDVIIELCQNRKLPLPEILRDEEELEDEEFDFNIYEYEEPKKIGFFGKLFAILIAVGAASQRKAKGQSSRCNGNCANCPSHYGYRYGRWYYGRGHTRGCQFGGNKGGGFLP